MKDKPDEPDPKAFERFKNLTRRLMAVPKKEVGAAVRKIRQAPQEAP